MRARPTCSASSPVALHQSRHCKSLLSLRIAHLHRFSNGKHKQEDTHIPGSAGRALHKSLIASVNAWKVDVVSSTVTCVLLGPPKSMPVGDLPPSSSTSYLTVKVYVSRAFAKSSGSGEIRIWRACSRPSFSALNATLSCSTD